MIRAARLDLLVLSFALLGTAALAASGPSAAAERPKIAKASKSKAAATDAPVKDSGKQAVAKPDLVGNFGQWGAYVTSGKNPTCYVLSQPQQRAPAALKRDPAYVFISTRPAEHVRNEVSIVMGFDVKDEPPTPARAEIGSADFDMVAKGSDLWLKDPAQDGAMLAAMKKSGRMTVKAASGRGNVTTDSYSLSGLNQALDRVLKSCK